MIVTSSWHARRARLLVQAALDPDVRLSVATPGRTRPPHLIGRELASLLPSASCAIPRAPPPLGYVSRIAPATTSIAPSAAFTENASPRKTTARMKTRTTLSRSSAATPVAVPSRSARK